MKIAIAQLNFHIGNFEGNLQKMLKASAEAKSKSADIVVFGELATCGYPPRDFVEFKDFIRLSEESVDQLREASDGIGIIVGSPTINPELQGKDHHNSVYFLYNGETILLQHKTSMTDGPSFRRLTRNRLPRHPTRPSRIHRNSLRSANSRSNHRTIASRLELPVAHFRGEHLSIRIRRVKPPAAPPLTGMP